MGTFGTPSSYNNTGALGSATNPTTAQGLSRDRENQKAVLELTGTQEWESVSILDGNITPTKAEIIVSAEGGATSDDLVSINTASDGTTTLHTGMLVKLRAADPGQTITVKHGSGVFNIQTIDSQDIVLGVSWSLELKLGSDNIWREQASRSRQIAESAKTSADNALARIAPATTTARGICRVATLADMEPGAEVGNGPAVLAAGSDALNALVPTFLIGSIISTYAADGYVPNGCVPTDGAEYTQSQFPSFYTDYLVTGKIVTCTYTEFDAQVALTGNCGKFALDTVNQKFKVPLLKDGDSITHASSASELGKSVKAGLPNITGATDGASIQAGKLSGTVGTGALRFTVQDSSGGSPNAGYCRGLISIDASLNNAIYGNSTTVTDEQVRLRHFVVVASAQNNASVFDWSNYMAGLAGKVNSDFSNVEKLPQSLLNISLNSSGEAPYYGCRAWVNFNGTGTVTIRASGNVSSITDIAVGSYTVNFTTAMPNANYAVSGAGGVLSNKPAYITYDSRTVSSVRVGNEGINVAYGTVDGAEQSVAIFI